MYILSMYTYNIYRKLVEVSMLKQRENRQPFFLHQMKTKR